MKNSEKDMAEKIRGNIGIPFGRSPFYGRPLKEFLKIQVPESQNEIRLSHPKRVAFLMPKYQIQKTAE